MDRRGGMDLRAGCRALENGGQSREGRPVAASRSVGPDRPFVGCGLTAPAAPRKMPRSFDLLPPHAADMTEKTDLSALRIDRGPRPSTGGERRGMLVAIALVLVAAAVVGWLRFAPRPLNVHVALAEATGGGSATGSG